MSGTKKKIRLGGLDADFDQFAVIVNYSTELIHMDDFGNTAATESQPGQKTIKLPRGLASQDIPELAAEVVEKCKYIPASKVKDVEQLLYVLMERENSGTKGPKAYSQSQAMQPQREMPPPPPMQGMMPTKKPVRQEPLLPNAELRFLDEYADQLYEEKMDLKVHGAKCILRVASEAKNLEFLADHETLIGVLSRELRESFKKSNELCVAIVCTFLCFSHFSQFHQILMQHQCGDVTLRVVEYESKRHQVRKEDMERQVQRLKDMGDLVSGEDKKLLARDEKKYRMQLSKQNKLMHACQMMLLNLAEEISIEKKMVNRKIPLLLVQLLDRTHEELMLVALQFLKKLSVFEENKDQISTPDTLSRLVQLSSHSNVRIALLALRCLYNLSFDESIRASLVESGIVKLLVDHLRNPPFRHIVLRLLYHFSMDDRCKSLMAYYQEGMIMLMQLVVHFPESRVGKDLVALVVNLASHPRCAEVMVTCGLFPQVMLRELKTRDPLLCKVVRHVTYHREVVEPMCELLESESVRMSKWIFEFVRMATSADNPDLLVEVLGTLANLTLPDIPWGELCEAGLIDLLHRLLVAGFSEDDLILECVMLLGNMAQCRQASPHLASSRLPGMLQDLLIEKRDDEEIIAQLLYTFQCLLIHEEVRDVMLHSPAHFAEGIMRLARSRNPQVVGNADKLLQTIMEYAGDLAASEEGAPSWAEQLKAFRFEQHNTTWCQSINRGMSGGIGMPSPGGYYDDDQGSGDEDEEEFAFHWAGGDAADVRDLANRQWKVDQDDLGGYSSRYVT